MTEAPQQTVLMIGATSSLAQAMCHVLAAQGYGLILAGRDVTELEFLAADLDTRHHTPTAILTIDFLARNFSPQRLLQQAEDFDHVIIATGDMGDNDADNLPNIAQNMTLNYTLPAQIATVCAEHLRTKKQGSITFISSVAGDRGRQSNYIYGSAKAALNAFASGMRNRYCKQGVHVMTVKPGFIDTPMTWGMKSPLIASREYVAQHIIAAMHKRKDVVYVPFFWKYIMLIIIHIPEKIFKRLSL